MLMRLNDRASCVCDLVVVEIAAAVEQLGEVQAVSPQVRSVGEVLASDAFGFAALQGAESFGECVTFGPGFPQLGAVSGCFTVGATVASTGRILSLRCADGDLGVSHVVFHSYSSRMIGWVTVAHSVRFVMSSGVIL